MSRRRSLWLTLVLAVGLGAAALWQSGCRSTGGVGAGARREARLVSPDDVAVPPAIRPGQIQPLAGEALERGGMSLEQVLSALPEPTYLDRVDEADGGDGGAARGESEPPVEVQRAYMNARQVWRAGRNHEAINQLDAALRLSPGQPDLLRLLARAYGAVGNRLRAAMYLRQSLEREPDHVDSLVMLGRLALEQDEPGEAAVLFSRALAAIADDAEGDAAGEAGGQSEASRAVLHYHLAAALLEADYPAAAIEQHRLYREHDVAHARAARGAPELELLDRRRGETWVAVGDAHHRLNDPAAAADAYEQAAEAGLAEAPALVHRMVYTHLRLGDAQAARQLVIDHVRAAGGDEASLELVAYLTEQGVSADELTRELERLYAGEGESGAMALAVAELMPRDAGLALLQRHMTAHPDDQQVFQRLLEDWLLADGAAAADADAVEQAVATTTDVMTHAPTFGDAEAAVDRLFQVAGNARELLAVWDRLSAGVRQRPMVRVIEGIALGREERMDAAAAAFERAMRDDAELTLARLQLAKVHMARRQYERAAALLEPLAESTDSVPVLLRIHVLAETDRVDEALALVDQVMREQSSVSVGLVLRKAQLQVQLGEAQAAERTLLDALNVRPEEERIYAALFELYAPGSETAAQIGDWQRQWSRLVRRLLGTIPDSRLGRLVRAQLLDAQGQRAEAEDLLKQLLDEQPRDHEALQQLLDLLVRADRRDEATALLESKLADHPEAMPLLAVARRYYMQIGDRERMLEMVERMLSLEPADETRARNLATLYIQIGRPADAVAVVDEVLNNEAVDEPLPLVRVLWRAMAQKGDAEAAQRRLAELAERMPEHRDALMFEQAMLAERVGDAARSEALLLQLIERDADHAMANNALGYRWTMENRNLERAKAMIQRAVDAEPDNGAYLDSLGWVYYKLGQFEEAVVWLRRSRAAEHGDYPVIVDHLGDALYRLGRADEAVRAWRDAKALLENGDFSWSEDPELDTLGETLDAKLTAIAEDREPPVSEVEGEGEGKGEQAERDEVEHAEE